ncbi:DNA polymerase III, subunit gamma and tau [Clostridium argentinense CDC 2741]|uniref:DNA-directed DNA polymerase n=4 Tax=Clostridium argentinense TaxID=29341 RepID=A0A0C1TVC2_9CLOT|nr:DNA polymerase III, subunit gamma and tau [Clostridium argentinense CDC 2741]NFF41326.1 DNA polymerase III subunit gamma/tau [Clostridium argentinense]
MINKNLKNDRAKSLKMKGESLKMLYQKYRPKTFQDVVGQGSTTEILRRQVKDKKFGHSYLLTGNRGSGKTTSARILAKAINCKNSTNGEPCNSCSNCVSIDNGTFVDVIEIDAASNNGVDNIRNIISNMQYGPQEGNYKVYIIDEAHMLTTGASNAFLKTLEEPPSYGIFILATTDPQKLPVTVLSRCQRFEFRRIQKDIILDRIIKISTKEEKNIEKGAADLISKLADGSMRDALSLLEQTFSLGDEIKYRDVSEMLGISMNETILELLHFIIQKNSLEALEKFAQVIESGKDITLFLQDFIRSWRNLLITKTSENVENLIIATPEEIQLLNIIKDKISVERILESIRILQELEKDLKISNERIAFEMAIIKMCKNESEGIYSMLSNIIKKLDELSPNDTNNLINNELPFIKEVEKELEEELSQTQELCQEDYKLIEATEKVIDKLKEFNRIELANMLEQSAFVRDNNTLTISTKAEYLETIISSSSNLTAGFSKYLDQQITLDVNIN